MTEIRPQTALAPIIGWALGVCVLLPLAPPPAAADWLVMEDGSKLETRGGWSVDGRRVIFTQPNGTLAAIRLREVDLAASEQATERAVRRRAEAQVEEPKEPPPPRWVWTDKDIPQASIATTRGVQIERLVAPEGLELLEVDESLDATGRNLVVRGTLVNRGGRYASGLEVVVALLSSDDGGTLDQSRAAIDTDELPPGSATRFVASFPNTDPGLGKVQVQVDADDSEEVVSATAADDVRTGR